MSGDGSLTSRLDALRHRVAVLVAAQRATEAQPDDPYRGLYVADHHVDRILASTPGDPATDAPESGLHVTEGSSHDPLGMLARRAELTSLDTNLLLAALAPDLDPGFERLYIYLNDDITRRRASVGVALRLAGAPLGDGAARARLLGGAPLVDLRLVEVDDDDRPFLSRGLRVPDGVLQHLLGHPVTPAALRDLALPTPAGWPDAAATDRLAAAFRTGRGFLHLHDPGDAGGVDLAHAVLARAGLDGLGIELGRASAAGLDAGTVVREVVVRNAGLVVTGADRARGDLLRDLVERAPAIVTVSREDWDPGATARTPLSATVTPAGPDHRRRLWSEAVATHDVDPAIEIGRLDTLRLSPSAIQRAGQMAARLAAIDRGPVRLAHLQDAARLQASPRLQKLARRVRPGVRWPDLVVPRDTLTDLELLVVRIRQRERVLDGWGLRRRSGHAEGVAALFAGDSGTGKTLAAEVIAAELALDLYVIDLSTVVDKYVGETEKNLERIFTEAEGVNGVLFFDEADALFGKRSEVSDARDRYANTEIAYLLQRIESFDGVAILATNLRSNLDDAFLRRLAAVVDFPEPDTAQRRRLWRLHLGEVPDDGRLDIDFLAASFALSGGGIRNAVVTGAYLAAAGTGRVGMAELVRAVALEYRKLGRLRDESEFGPWVEVLTEGWTAPDLTRSGHGNRTGTSTSETVEVA